MGESRTVFTSHADAAFDVCFENIMTGGKILPSATAWAPLHNLPSSATDPLTRRDLTFGASRPPP